MNVFLTYKEVSEHQISKALKSKIEVFDRKDDQSENRFNEFYKAIMGHRNSIFTRQGIVPFMLDTELISMYLGNNYQDICIRIAAEIAEEYPHISIIFYSCDCDFKAKKDKIEAIFKDPSKVGLKKCTCGGSDIIPRLIS